MNPHNLKNKKKLNWWETQLAGHLINDVPYHEAEGVSRSSLSRAFEGMDEYWRPIEPKEPTPAMEQGTMFDTFMLRYSDNDFWDEYAIWEMPYPIGTELPNGKPSRGMTNKENKDAWKMWVEANPNKKPVTPDDLSKLNQMQSALTTVPDGFNPGEHFMSLAMRGKVFYRVPLSAHINGVLCKAEIDVLKITGDAESLIVVPCDIKRLDKCTTKAFIKSAHDFHYDIQDVFYTMVLEKVFPAKNCIVMKQTYLVTEWRDNPRANAFDIDDDDREFVREWILSTLDKIREGDKSTLAHMNKENFGVKTVNIKRWKYYE